MSEVGCYSLHLYCDDPLHEERLAVPTPDYPFGQTGLVGPGEYIGRDLAEARKEAKKNGWHFLRERNPEDLPLWGGAKKTICPMCWKANFPLA